MRLLCNRQCCVWYINKPAWSWPFVSLRCISYLTGENEILNMGREKRMYAVRVQERDGLQRVMRHARA